MVKFNKYSSKLFLFNKTKIKFLVIGLLNTIVGYAIFAILIFFETPHLVALFIATIFGVIFNYFSTGRLVFKSRGGSVVFAKFIVAYGVIYLVNATALDSLINVLTIMPSLGQALCVPPVVLLSWLLMNNWVFSGK